MSLTALPGEGEEGPGRPSFSHQGERGCTCRSAFSFPGEGNGNSGTTLYRNSSLVRTPFMGEWQRDRHRRAVSHRWGNRQGWSAPSARLPPWWAVKDTKWGCRLRENGLCARRSLGNQWGRRPGQSAPFAKLPPVGEKHGKSDHSPAWHFLTQGRIQTRWWQQDDLLCTTHGWPLRMYNQRMTSS